MPELPLHHGTSGVDARREKYPTGRPTVTSRLTTVLLLIAFAVGVPVLSAAQQIQATEIQVKAAFLLNFGRYVTWSQPPEGNFSICVLGQDPFGQTIDGIVSGEKVGAKPAEVRRLHALSEASYCQVLFISASEEPRLTAILGSLSKAPILTVSDIPHFAERGGMIQFVTESNRVRFIVNLAAAQKAGLGLSSELLKVAKSVQRDENAGVM